MFLNKNTQELHAYEVSSHSAWENHSFNVLKLDWNESTISPSFRVLQALHDHIYHGKLNWYPDTDNQKLRYLIADYSDIPVNFVEYFAGADAVHETLVRATIEIGDHLTLIAPTYDNFRASAQSAGATIDFFWLREEDGFAFREDDFCVFLEQHRSKFVYLCNPNNPTGTLYSVATIERLLSRFPNSLFIVDEAYYEFEKVSAASLLAQHNNLVVCRSFSKAFGLASFRMGYVLTNPTLLHGLQKLRNPKSIASLAQVAAIEALYDRQYMLEYVASVTRAKRQFICALESLGIHIFGSVGGNFVLVDFCAKKNKIVAGLEAQGIYVRSFPSIHALEKYTRISIGTEEEMARVVSAIRLYFDASD